MLKYSIIVLLCIVFFSDCTKVDTPGINNDVNQKSETYIDQPPTNEEMLQMVLTGIGGYICETEGGIVTMPSYTPPVLENNILTFEKLEEYEKYTEALDILADHWTYSEEDYEDHPDEIYHLGDESNNAVDQALNFNSLRYQYELNDFYDSEWEDTASVIVEDIDLVNVMNTDREVKIADKYFKFISTNVYAVISNSDYEALEKVRNFGFSAINYSNVQFINQVSNQPLTEIYATGQGSCEDFYISIWADILTATPLNNTWEIELNLATHHTTWGSLTYTPIVGGTYTINWGDGTVESFYTDEAQYLKKRRHIYSDNFAPGVEVLKNISVTFVVQLANWQMLALCPDIVGESYQAEKEVSFINPVACLGGYHFNKSHSQSYSIGGILYRLKYKLIQHGFPSGFNAKSKYKSVAILQKRKNGKWKKIRPLHTVGTKMIGRIYDQEIAINCTSIREDINLEKVASHAKKVKLNKSFEGATRSSITPPEHLHADYYFTYFSNGVIQTHTISDIKLY